MTDVMRSIRKQLSFLTLGVMIFIAVWIVLPRLDQFTETRFMRDLRGVTPFHDVVVTRVVATPYTLMVVARAIKDRDCLLIGVPGVIIHQYKGPDLDVGIYTSLEPAGTPIRRVPSPFSRVFGPFLFTSPIPWPKSVTMLRTHVGGDCTRQQTNAFYTVPWVSSGMEQPQ